MKGFFITLEGIEGTGKSTQAKALYESLTEMGYPTVFSREPGGTRIGNLIREILINPEYHEMCVLTEIFLFAAARAQHVEQLFRPKLEEGYVVICDRFADSSIAYQGYGRNVPLALIREINSAATWSIQPNLTFFLDLEPETALHRVRLRVEETETIPDRLEREQLDFFHKVRNGYRRIAQEEPHRFRWLDATLEPEALHKKITDLCLREMRKAGIQSRRELQAPESWQIIDS
ncbi:MAG: dTMP kinase [Candidatus Xenobiia bacterium LiM19]